MRRVEQTQQISVSLQELQKAGNNIWQCLTK